MASESDVAEFSTLVERMIMNRDLPLFLPFIFGFTNFGSFGRGSPNPEAQQQNSAPPTTSPTAMDTTTGTEAARTTATAPRDRLVFINPFTQTGFIMDGASNWVTLLRDMGHKGGQPPASKESIESMPCLEIAEGEIGECVICLEEWEVGGVVKEMPCQHKFHGNCIESWLRIHGSCPVCRYQMPADLSDMGQKNDDERRGERRQIWFQFSVDGRSGYSDQPQSQAQAPANLNDSSSPTRADGENEGENLFL